jgi:cytoskeletal protein CcmA (bactofilin family)
MKTPRGASVCGRRGRAMAMFLALAVLSPMGSWADDDDQREERTRELVTPSGLHFLAGPNTTVTDVTADDLFAAGGNVTIGKSTAGDLFAAGGNISMVSVTSANLIAAAGNLSLNDMTVDDAILAGGDLNIGGAITDDLIAAGGQVHLRRDASVGGDAVVSGGVLDLDGRIAGDARLAAGEVRIAGAIGGNVEVAAGEIDLVPGASITGNLTYRSRSELKVPEGVTIGGKIERGPPLGRMGRDAGAMRTRLIAAGMGAWIGLGVSLIVLAAAALAAFPALLGNAVTQFQRRPLASLGLGFAIAVAVPVAVAILVALLAGIPLAIVGFSLYAAALGTALVAVCLWAGLSLRHRLGRPGAVATYGLRLGWASLGVLLVMVVGLVPIVGALALMLAILTALGALALATWGAPATG